MTPARAVAKETNYGTDYPSFRNGKEKKEWHPPTPPKTFKSVIRQSPLPDVIPISHKWHAIFGAGALEVSILNHVNFM